MQVRVYRNLHKKCFSVQAKENGRWLVIAHCHEIYLTGVTFKVSQAGRERVIREQRKNVHAFIEGTWVQYPDNDGAFRDSRVVKYNPYKSAHFTIDNQPITYAKGCLVASTTLAHF